MMEAQTWYEYQENYKKYGLDMGPRREKRTRKKSALTARDKGRMLLMLGAAGILCLIMIVASAYAAAIQYDINQTIKANNELRSELESLEIKIETSNNLINLEKEAVGKLGMVPAKKGQIVHLSNNEKDKSQKTAAEKEKVYN